MVQLQKPPSMRLAIHDERGDPAAEAFLTEFLPSVGASMATRLGIALTGEVNVILSTRVVHEQRFPPRAHEAVEVLDRFNPEESRADPAAVAARYPRQTYAHGIATKVHPQHTPPSNATVGAAGIYLDMDSIEALAAEADVLFEGMLGRVVAHELAHVLRGHIDGSDRVVHGWVAEGDAQRDAWHALTESLADPTWTGIARWGRAAQVRLARHQPPAYSQFYASQAERQALGLHQPFQGPDAWLVTPPRAVYILVHEGVVETPIVGARQAPVPGDAVHFLDFDMVAGPWVVTATARESRLSHPEDLKAVKRKQADKPSYLDRRATVWLSLRPLGRLMAGSPTDAPDRGLPEGLPLDSTAARKLAAFLITDAAAMARTVADEKIVCHRECADSHATHLRETGKTVPEWLTAPYNPFNDRPNR
jgi:hypothetical protein